jgi:hypothetical protein
VSEKPDVEWVSSGGDGAMNEIAETLGVPHDLIMFARQIGGPNVVQAGYTPDYPEDRTLWSAVLVRGLDGVLTLARKDPMPGAMEELDRRMAEEMGGDPE